MKYIFEYCLIIGFIVVHFCIQGQKHTYLYNGLKSTDAKVYLVGERHDIVEKFQTQINAIKFLHQHKRVGIIVFEHPFSYGIKINQFFNSGDSLFLKEFLKQQKGSSDPEITPKYHFFMQLYRYQKLQSEGIEKTIPKRNSIFLLPDISKGY